MVFELPFLEFQSWEDSTIAKDTMFAEYSTWRYQLDDSGVKKVRLVFLSGPARIAAAQSGSFDLGRFWRIATITIEQSLARHFAAAGMGIEDARFERVALRAAPQDGHGPVEFSTGLSFRAKRPFNDDPYRFLVIFQWEVRAIFRETLEDQHLRRVAVGMPTIYIPNGETPRDLAGFRNRFVGRIVSFEGNDTAVVESHSGDSRHIPVSDLRLEASPAVMKRYEIDSGVSSGPSQLIRRIQQLNMTLTKENRRNVSVLRDRLAAVVDVLRQTAGASRDQLVASLDSYQAGTLNVALSPATVEFGGLW